LTLRFNVSRDIPERGWQSYSAFSPVR